MLALDGQPLARPKPLDMAVVAPGQRLDLAIRMPDSEGQEASLIDLRPSTPKWWRASRRQAPPSSGRFPRPRPTAQSLRGTGSRQRRAYSTFPQLHGGKRRARFDLRHAGLQFLGHQQGGLAGRYARSDGAAGRAETGAKLCLRSRQHHAACPPHSPARHEFQGGRVIERPGRSVDLRYLSRPAG